MWGKDVAFRKMIPGVQTWTELRPQVIAGLALAAIGLSSSGPAAAEPQIAMLTPPIPEAGRYNRPLSKRETLHRAFHAELQQELWLEDFPDLEQAVGTGWLVDIPTTSDDLGITLRTSGPSRIGEMETDPHRREMLLKLSRPAAGLLFRIARYLQEVEGDHFVPLELTSMVRPWSYQKRLMHINPNADTIKQKVPPTHVLGMAFDIARKGMSPGRESRLHSYLEQMSKVGLVVYFREGRNQSTYHVTAMPQGWPLFERDYEEFVAAGMAEQKNQWLVSDSDGPGWGRFED